MLTVTAALAHVRAGKARLPVLAPGWTAAVFASTLHEDQKIILDLTQSGPSWDPVQRDPVQIASSPTATDPEGSAMLPSTAPTRVQPGMTHAGNAVAQSVLRRRHGLRCTCLLREQLPPAVIH